jgi:hypothetical protein
MFVLRLLARPFGYLAVAMALVALSAAARLLGERNQIGVICGRLADTIWRHPDVTRPGFRFAWVLWAVALGVTLSPLDPFASRWDEVVLAALGLGVLWRRLFASH